MNLPAAPLMPASSASPVVFRHVAIVGKYQALGSRAALDDIAQFLHTQGCDVALETETALNTGLVQYPSLTLEQIGAACDLALVVGGDGTMLGVGRQLARYGVPVIGINQGRLGFMTDVRFEDFPATLHGMLRGQYEEDPRALILARVLRDGACVYETMAMNDVVVNRASAGMIELKIDVGGRFVARQRADGLIVATPTGSTAYALSAGGPLLHPAIDGWVLAPIAPHTLSNRPIVLPCDQEIVIEVVGGREISANFDMQTFTSLIHGDQISVQRAGHELRLLHPVGWSHFDTLRNKLHWNEGVIGSQP
ncbi:MAG: NAD kinase [Polaromonas sp.]|nr:NAD kinase [Polaromonas sp.]